MGGGDGWGEWDWRAGEWRQLYLNNNKKKEKRKTRFFLTMKDIILKRVNQMLLKLEKGCSGHIVDKNKGFVYIK